MARASRLAAATALLAALPALLAAGEEAEGEGESSLDLLLEGDLEFARESRGGEASAEAVFDEVGVTIGAGAWELETGLKYDSAGGGRLVIEEGSLRLGGGEGLPWFLRAGRTSVPFGEYDARFIEDPLVVNAGETIADALMAGYAGERLEAAAAIFRGKSGGDPDYALVLKLSPSGRLAAGVSWSSDVREAVELRELRQDAREAALSPADGSRPADGLAAFARFDAGSFLLYGEGVLALAPLPPGLIAAGELRPAAWNAEFALRPAPRWEVAARAEGGRDLPGVPARQFGLAASWSGSRHLAVTAEYLRGAYAGDEPARHLAGLKFALSY